MKVIAKKVFFYAVILFLVLLVSGFIFVLTQGRSLLKSQLTRVLKREVNFSAVRLSPFLALEIRNLDIRDFAKIDKVEVAPIIVGFTRNKVILGKVSFFQPALSVRKSADGNWDFPEGIKEKFAGKAGGGPMPLLVSGILVKSGNLKFSDETKTPAFNFSVRNINLDVGNKILSFNPILTRFQARADIVTQTDKPASFFNSQGWVDFLRKDMKGMVQLSELDAVYFLPLYSKYMTSNLKNAILSFKSDLAAKSNDLVANCRLEIRDLIFEKAKDETAPTISFLDIVTGGLQTENKEVNVDFVIKTKLDNPRIDMVKLSGSIMAKAMGEQMIQSPTQTIENIKSVGKEFEKLGKSILKEKLGIDLSGKKEGEEVNAPSPNVTNTEVPSP